MSLSDVTSRGWRTKRVGAWKIPWEPRKLGTNTQVHTASQSRPAESPLSLPLTVGDAKPRAGTVQPQDGDMETPGPTETAGGGIPEFCFSEPRLRSCTRLRVAATVLAPP